MIGIFDSGLGGTAILQAIQNLLPSMDIAYVADTAYLPYGTKSPSEIQLRSALISRFLINLQVDIIVIACNTATAAAISTLREQFVIPFVGTQPAIKPALAHAPNQPVWVLATPVTLASQQFQQLVKTHFSTHPLNTASFPSWIKLVESGHHLTPSAKRQIKSDLSHLPPNSHLVLSCTHYLHFELLIHQLFPQMTVHNPASAIAQQVLRCLPHHTQSPSKQTGHTTIYSTTPPNHSALNLLLKRPFSVKSIQL